MSAPNKTLRLIHFYNKDGFVHYTSSVVPGLREPPDCRVADVVRSLDDVCDRTVGILPSTVAPETLREVMSPTAMNLAFVEEAIRVALALPTWINNIWMNSPMRDSAIWTGERTVPPGVWSGIDPGEIALSPGGLKAQWRADRERRRKAWETDRLILPLGVKV